MAQRFVLSFLLFFALATTARGSAIFYSDLAAYNAAVAAAGITTGLIDFESVPVADYSTAAGLTVNGLKFVGPFGSGFFLRVFDEADSGSHFEPGTGNTLSGVGEIDITLPPGTRAFGANVGETFVWATGGSSHVEFRLSTGESASTPVSPSRLFPFFGFVSTDPVSRVDVGFGASFITIDNVRSGAAPVPEPSTFALSACPILFAIVFQQWKKRR